MFIQISFFFVIFMIEYKFKIDSFNKLGTYMIVVHLGNDCIFHLCIATQHIFLFVTYDICPLIHILEKMEPRFQIYDINWQNLNAGGHYNLFDRYDEEHWTERAFCQQTWERAHMRNRRSQSAYARRNEEQAMDGQHNRNYCPICCLPHTN